MSPAAQLPLTIIADDLTGACDTGALFAARGLVPVAETAIAEDPTFPRASGSSNVVDLLRPQLDRPLAWIPLGRVREGGSALTARLVRLAGMVIVADAETDADLDALIEAVLELDAPPLLVGSAGLALALARRLGLSTARVDPPAGERWLIVAGSQHPATRRQVEAARDAGLMVLATPDAPQADRAGVGPEIIARAGAEPAVRRDSRPVVIGAASAMSAALALVASPLTLHAVKRVADCRWADRTLEVLDLGNVDMASLPRAAVSAAAGQAAYDYVERAVALAQAHEIHGIVTAPINKEALAAAGMPHTGHTEILARLSNTADYAMLLLGRELRVIHVTTHVALRRVPDLVTRERVLKTIRL